VKIPVKTAGRFWCSGWVGCGEVGKPGTQDAWAHSVSLLSGFAQAGFLNWGLGQVAGAGEVGREFHISIGPITATRFSLPFRKLF